MTTTWVRRFLVVPLGLAVILAMAPGVRAADPTPVPAGEDQGGPIGPTPPRLSWVHREVSFWRPGAQDWAPAQVNTPLALGDELYSSNNGGLELQIGGRAFVRTWTDTQIGLVNQEPDFLQLKVTAGHVSLDLRTVDPGRSVEIDTPQAAFTIDAPGYYRVDVTAERTSFITRRSGRATLTPAGGQTVAVAPGEEVVLVGAPTPTVQRFVAPQPDAWDTWNSTRTDQLLDSVSARYVQSNVYGVNDLDRYGHWGAVPSYGTVWLPDAVPAGWAPYSTGRWIADPYYGWTWVDTAPWGWAPYHYGRWIFVDSYWAWAPGPIVARPVYAPALVVFFSLPGVRVAIGTPFVSWVALGWGEPVIPWWGSPSDVGRPWWGGWGGPRVVNNVVVNRTTVVNVRNITVYQNVNVRNAVVAVREDSFGRRGVREARVREVDVRRLEPVRGRLHVTPDASSFVAANGRGARPSPETLRREVVTNRRPAERPGWHDGRREQDRPAVTTPVPRARPVEPPRRPLPTRPETGRRDSTPLVSPPGTTPQDDQREPGNRREPRSSERGSDRREANPAAPHPAVTPRPTPHLRREEPANPVSRARQEPAGQRIAPVLTPPVRTPRDDRHDRREQRAPERGPERRDAGPAIPRHAVEPRPAPHPRRDEPARWVTPGRQEPAGQHTAPADVRSQRPSHAGGQPAAAHLNARPPAPPRYSDHRTRRESQGHLGDRP